MTLRNTGLSTFLLFAVAIAATACDKKAPSPTDPPSVAKKSAPKAAPASSKRIWPGLENFMMRVAKSMR